MVRWTETREGLKGGTKRSAGKARPGAAVKTPDGAPKGATRGREPRVFDDCAPSRRAVPLALCGGQETALQARGKRASPGPAKEYG